MNFDLTNFTAKNYLENPKEFNLLQSSELNICILGLLPNEFISLLGYTNLSILKGGVECLGYDINTSLQTPQALKNTEKLPKLPLFSSKTTSLLTLKSKKIYKNPNLAQYTDSLELTDDIKSTIEKFESNNELYKSFETVILFEANASGISNLQALDNRFRFIFSPQNDEKLTNLHSNLYLCTANNNNFQNFNTNSNWLFILEEFSKFSKAYEHFQINRKPILLVCGGKNTGKSSFSKYAINKLLNTHDKVAYLNCDPGQTELNPAGYLTLHILDQPLLGPNFSQLKQPTSGFYLGDHNVKSNPDYFIKGCAELIKTYTDLTESTQSGKNQRIPLIVNTYGWVKRLGMDCLIKLTEHLKPSHLVQFHSNLIQSYQLGQPLPITPIQQFPFSMDPFPTNVKSDLIHHMDTLNENPSTCRLFLIPTISELMNLNSNTTKFTHQKFQPIDHRDLLIYSYFHKNFDKLEWSSKPLQSIETYPIPINSVELWNLQEDCIDLSQVLYAFNLSLVALYTFKGDLEITPNKNEKVPNYISPQVANYPPSEHYDCIGFAIIKSIDTTNNTINLLSPLPSSELSKVRALVKGELNFPTNIIIEGDENLEKLPYFSQKRLKMGGFGASSKKSRTNLKRVETLSPINK